MYRPRTLICAMFLSCAALVASAANAHDGDALPTTSHFPAVDTDTTTVLSARTALAHRQGETPARSSPADRNATAAASVGADRLSVYGNPAFGRVGTP